MWSAIVKQPARLQSQIDELIERISHLRAQNDERRDDKIKAEMHALTKKPCNGPALRTQDRRPNAFHSVGNTRVF